VARGTTADGIEQEPIEIEWQFDALDLRPVERWLAALPTAVAVGTHFPTVTAQAKPSRRLIDHYLDTEDWRIARAGFVLRTRRHGRSDEATMKDRHPAAAGGLRRRLEVTEQLAPDGAIDALDNGPVGRRVRALAGTRPLNQVLEVRTRRRPFSLRVGGTEVAEVALDETSITAGQDARPVRLRRVEVEVDAEWVERLTPMVEGLRRSCGLQAAELSKFEAGLLSLGLSVPGAPELGATDIGPETSIGELAYAVLRRHLGVLLAREPGTRLGDDIEELHDMRVATRRLRAALDLFAHVLPARAVSLRAELAWLADALGAVRDLDVQLARMGVMTQWSANWAVASTGDTGGDPLDHLAQLLASERGVARQNLLSTLDSSRWDRISADLVTLVTQPPARRPRGFSVPAVTVTYGLIEAHHHRAVKAAKRAKGTGQPGDFHRLRIRCKRLRYSLEFTADLYDGRTERFTRQLAKLQDGLGLMQDAEVATTRLAALATSGDALPAPTIFVMGGVAEHYRMEAAGLLRTMPRRLRVLRGKDWQELVELMGRRQERAIELLPVRAVPSAEHSDMPDDDGLQGNEQATGGGDLAATTTAPAALATPLPSAAAALAAWPDPVWGPPETDNLDSTMAVVNGAPSPRPGDERPAPPQTPPG